MILFELAGLSCIAAFVDTLAGGGGLITLPAVLLTGIPVINVLATNKLQSLFGSSTATAMMVWHKLLDIRKHQIVFLCALAGAVFGTYLVQRINAHALDVAIPVALLAICAYVIFSPSVGEVETRARIGKGWYQGIVVPLIGMYDGILGPGTGSFFALSAVALRGERLLHATAQAKLLNFGTNFASALVFICSGHVVWSIALAMGMGQIIGAIAGSFVLSRGHTRLIRPMIVAVSLGMIIRYLWQHFHHA